MFKNLMAWYEKLILSNPLVSLILVLLLAAVMALGLPNLKIDASADSLTLEHDTDLDYFRAMNQRYGGSDFVVVTYSPIDLDLFSDESIELLESLQNDLLKVEGVVAATSMLNAPLLYSPKIAVSDLGGELNTLLSSGVDRDLVKQEFHQSPIYRDLILSPDESTTALMLTFASNPQATAMVRERDALRLKRDTEGLTAEEATALENISKQYLDLRTTNAQKSFQRIDRIRDVVAGYRDRAELVLGGPSMITADMVSFIKSDLRVFGLGILAFIVLLLAVIFRQVRWVFLPLVTCVLSVIVVLGLLGWLDWRLTVISSNFVALLLIITLALTIHLIVRYREYYQDDPQRSQYELVRDTVAFMARPCLYTALTTVVAFVSLVVSDIRPVIDFGWMMTLGILVAFTLAFIVIPAGMLLLGKGKVTDGEDNSGAFTLWFSRITENHGRLVLTFFILAGLFSGWGISRLEVENRFIDYFKSDTEIYRGLSVIDSKLGGTTPLDILLEAPDRSYLPGLEGVNLDEEDPFAVEDPFAEEDPFAGEEEVADNQSYWFTGAGMKKLDKLHRYLESLDELGKVTSLATVYQVATDLMDKPLNDLELAFVKDSITGANAELLISPYFDEANDQTRITIRAKETEGNLRRSELLQKIQQYAEAELGIESEEIRFTSLLVLYNNMLQSLFRSQILTLGTVFVGIMLMFLVLFRSMKVAVVAIIPNLLASLVVLGGMGAAGIPLDMMTITIAAITLGIGVDNTIHYVYRFKAEFANRAEYIGAMHRSHGSIGRAMYYTSITIVMGFSILTLSEFVPSIYFGLLTGLAMIAALLGALLLLPKLILLTQPFGDEQAG